MKLIVAGSRSLYKAPKPRLNSYIQNYYSILEQTIELLEQKKGKEVTEIVHGACKDSPDILGDYYAKVYDLKCTPYPADWKKYDLAAGPIRNAQMAEYGDIAICFLDVADLNKKSSGTRNMIDEMKKRKKIVIILKFENFAFQS